MSNCDFDLAVTIRELPYVLPESALGSEDHTQKWKGCSQDHDRFGAGRSDRRAVYQARRESAAPKSSDRRAVYQARRESSV